MTVVNEAAIALYQAPYALAPIKNPPKRVSALGERLAWPARRRVRKRTDDLLATP
jgi:hypothetical protein